MGEMTMKKVMRRSVLRRLFPYLFTILCLLLAFNPIVPPEPASQIKIGASLGAKRTKIQNRWFPAKGTKRRHRARHLNQLIGLVKAFLEGTVNSKLQNSRRLL